MLYIRVKYICSYVCAPFSTLGYSIFYSMRSGNISIRIFSGSTFFAFAFFSQPAFHLGIFLFFPFFGKRVARREFVLICAQKLLNKNADIGTVN